MARDGYQVMLTGPDTVLRTGLCPYWQTDFSSLLLEVNKKIGADLFPLASVEADGSAVTYTLSGEDGSDVLRNSVSLREKAIPTQCLKTLQDGINQLHAWADDVRVPQEKREFCRKFRLPDPKNDAAAYRMSGGSFSRKLHVLWGVQKEGSEAFLPCSPLSEKWDDAVLRKEISKECQGSVLRRIFRLRNIVLALLLAAGIYAGLFLPVKCPVHGCLVGKGAYNYLGIEERCPKRCALTGCNRHLDDKEKCNAHKCTKCGKMMPVGQSGKCEPCLWVLK